MNSAVNTNVIGWCKHCNDLSTGYHSSAGFTCDKCFKTTTPCKRYPVIRDGMHTFRAPDEA